MPKHTTNIDAAANALERMATGDHETRAAGFPDRVDELLARGSGFVSLFGGDATGIRVTPEVAMSGSAVYACINVLASAIAALPVSVIDRKSGEGFPNHPAQRVLDEPNEYMPPVSFWEAFVVNLCGWGNGYAAAPRDPATFRVRELLPILSSATEPRRENGRLFYATQLGASDPKALPADNVLHVRNMSFGGIVGISPVEAMRRTFGISVALEEFAARFFKNGANVQSVLELPKMNQTALEEFKRRWGQEYAGIENVHKTAAVPEIKVHRLGADPAEAQALESRVYQVREACRVYRVPPHMVADLERATFSNIEEQNRDFAQNSLRPWIVKIEQGLDRLMLRADERRRLRIKFNMDALLRASTKDRYAAHNKACGGPFMTVNEVRALEDKPPIKGGDRLMTPLNTAPAEKRNTPEMRAELRRVMEVAAGQVVRKEINAAKRAAKKYADDAEGFRSWAEGFYDDEHTQRLARSLGFDERSQAVAEMFCGVSRLALIQAHESRDVDELLKLWESRAAELVNHVLGPEPSADADEENDTE